jgi:hypothetical protein
LISARAEGSFVILSLTKSGSGGQLIREHYLRQLSAINRLPSAFENDKKTSCFATRKII